MLHAKVQYHRSILRGRIKALQLALATTLIWAVQPVFQPVALLMSEKENTKVITIYKV